LGVLFAEGLTHRYANGLGVFDVSLTLRRGEILCILGANGSGKTTLLRLLATLDPPSAGRVGWFGTEDRRSPQVRRRMGVTLDQPVHFEALSGWQNARFFAAQYGLKGARAERRLGDLFEWAGIGPVSGLPVREYSLGMRRRLALIEALAHDPDLLVLDEPGLALDEQGEIDLVGRLHELSQVGTAVLVATNDAPLADALAGRWVRLERGRVAAPSEAA
jgi:ABC-2 type transport system ATP-binding protein